MVADRVVAAAVALSVSASLPFLLYGAWIVLDADPVTWSVLMRHLRYVLTGLLLTTVPMLVWMVPRLLGLGANTTQFSGLAVAHAVVGAQAYALLLFGFTGIVRIFRAKRAHDLYHDYDEDVLLEEIGGDRMSHWRSRLRVGVFGYTLLWLVAWVTGLVRFAGRYQVL